MTDELEIMGEDSAMAETVTVVPAEEKLPITAQPEVCDPLWLPPCPRCSWIETWRRPALDRLEQPGFYIASHTSSRYGQNYYMLRGCQHATELGCQIGPTTDRLKAAIAWRRAAGRTCRALLKKRSPEQRTLFASRISHPSLVPPPL